MASESEREFGRHAILCGTLVAFAISLPLVSPGGIGSTILRWGTAGILLASVFEISVEQVTDDLESSVEPARCSSR